MPHLVRVTGFFVALTLLLAIAVNTAHAAVGQLPTAAANPTDVGRLSIAAAANPTNVGRLSIAAAANPTNVGRLSIAAATAADVGRLSIAATTAAATEDPDPPEDSPLVCLALVAGTALLAGGVWMAKLRRLLR